MVSKRPGMTLAIWGVGIGILVLLGVALNGDSIAAPQPAPATQTATATAPASSTIRLRDYPLYKENYLAFWVDEQHDGPVWLKADPEGQFSVEYRIVDQSGRRVYAGKLLPQRKIKFAMSDLPPGIYFAQLFCWGGKYRVSFGEGRPWIFVNKNIKPGSIHFPHPWPNLPLYFYVPKEVTSLELRVNAVLKGAVMALSSPSGNVAINETLATYQSPYKFVVPQVAAEDRDAVWMVLLTNPGRGRLWFPQDKQVSEIFSLQPEYVRFFADKVYQK